MSKLSNQTIIFTQLAREAIIMGETKRAISLMLENIQKIDEKKYNEIYDNVCLLSNSLNQVKKNKRLGLVKSEEANIESARINNALINIISNFEAKLDLNTVRHNQNSMTILRIPRNGVPNKLYYSFVIVGISCGIICAISFMIMFYNYLTKSSGRIEELLFLGTLGTSASMFFSGALDGLNRRRGNLIDWRIILPHMIVSILFSVLAGIVSIFR